MFRICLGLVLISCLAIVVLSCSHSQELESIQIQPQSQSFGASNIPLNQDAGANVQLRALGSYIHPPVTKDVTNQVTWSSNTPNITTVSSRGVLTATGLACGNALVSATVQTNSGGGISSQGAIVTGYMTASVVCFTGGGPTITADFTGTGGGTGTISSSPVGLGCATTCTASFPIGTNVTITASPTGGSTFGGWAGCDSVSGNLCLIQNLTTNITVTVTFNH